jgi:arsenite methyltransferase
VSIRRYLSEQAARPHGPVGRLLARNWLRETAAANDIAVDLLHPRPGERICEIGFGPGRTVARLAAAGAHVLGVDIAADMLTLAGRRNMAAIAAGRVELVHGDGTALPAADGTLDAAISVHCLYFWPDQAAVLAELRRVLRPGGPLVLALRPADDPLPARLDPAVYQVPTIAELRRLLREAGFTDIRVERRPRPAAIAWITAT